MNIRTYIVRHLINYKHKKGTYLTNSTNIVSLVVLSVSINTCLVTPLVTPTIERVSRDGSDGSDSPADVGAGQASRDGSDGFDSTVDVGAGQVSRDGSDGSDSTADVGTGQVSRDAARVPSYCPPKDNRNFLSRALYNAICPPMGDA